MSITLGYDGIPTWLYNKFDVPTDHPYPWPFVDSNFQSWICGYFTEECGTGFQQLYENKAGAVDKMGAVWAKLAEINKGFNAVLGYELLNEPWAGDIYADMTRLLPGNAGRQNLAPFYENITAAIRAVNDDALIFYEPVTWGVFVPTQPDPLIDMFLNNLVAIEGMNLMGTIMPLICGELQPNATEILLDKFEGLKAYLISSLEEDDPYSVLSPGFAHVPGGSQYNDRSVLSWHYYCWLIGYATADEPYDMFTKGICDNVLGPLVGYTSEERTTEIGGGRMLTEFGTCHTNSSNPDGRGYIECEFVLEEAEKHFSSWTYWDTADGGSFWDADGNPDLEHIKIFSRPYPIATAGTPHKLRFDPETRIFTYLFISDTTITAPTELFIPPMWYTPGEYTVRTSPDLTYTVDEQNPSIIRVTGSATEKKYSFFQITPFTVVKDEL